MKTLQENDVFQLSAALEAQVIGDERNITIPAGSVVTVVAVFGDSDSPEAYEVEAYLPHLDAYALTTVSASDV
ncbi:hypothetical protein NK8_64790 (plasmid) [Caballeronia sp. NK8]|uniref:hypothetical protein n=1 Tax=Caballeronia sp. NK8 TaxID=140098 RepID=UPI001BB6DEAE|nr:hypothetical protein [Caballeronia sp. NK8]BCQ28290.1 hypothetical protein NK8_64790 [Caballeronia sp. NK8]